LNDVVPTGKIIREIEQVTQNHDYCIIINKKGVYAVFQSSISFIVKNLFLEIRDESLSLE
jgi:hypothetical protein